ncbi:MAG: diguanylate cyclase [Cyanobacteria bacterium SZAS LIN-2]|nr:diguanylate cyclase [Cyanobacteria bacterium SZAS LIN-3]MBS1994740.1 diguanylate cyclase [Cyanobacteria bacterium SZAS LIN-2]
MSKRILHAEQEESVATLLKTLVVARGHEIEQTPTGTVAVEKLIGQEYDLIVVGDELDDIDGIGLITKLRQINSQVPIVLISKVWRDARIYQQLVKELQVALVIHRPIKAGLFGAQLESIFDSQAAFSLGELGPEEATLRTLQANYLRVLPERVFKLKEAIAISRTNPAVGSHLIEAIRLAHNLKGTATSCGFGILGESAGSLEKALVAIKEGDLGHYDVAWEEIDLIMKLVTTNAHAIAENPSSKVDKRAFATLENPDERVLSMAPEAEGAEPLPEDNFDTFDMSSSVRVLVVSKEAPASFRKIRDDSKMQAVQVICCQEKEDAVAIAQKLSLDAVLIDIDTAQPGPSLNLARELRSLPNYDSLPVAFLSTSKQQKYIEDSTHAGASLMLEMPFAPNILDDAIDYLVNARQGGRPRILVMDDDQDFSETVAATLGQEGMLVRCINEPGDIMETLHDYHPDLVLLNITMPLVSGYDICRMIRQDAHYRDLPILFLTSQTGLETRLAAFEAGGDDYLPKPVARVELLTRVKVRLERARLLKERSNKDVLTGLLIRRAFMEELQDMAEESRRNELIFSLALIDVDHFKKINDTYGHMAGDKVLAQVGQLLRKRFRVEDVRGRWGGEEFIVAFRHIQKDTARGALQRALEELRSQTFTGDHGENFGITFSAGLVSYPDDGRELDTLIKIADHRLYRAKEQGRNCLVCVDT